MDTHEHTREWRRKRYRHTRRDWMTYTGLGVMVLVTAGVVAAALMR